MTSSADGLWKGYKSNGFIAYYLNKHPLLVFLNTIFFIAPEIRTMLEFRICTDTCYLLLKGNLKLGIKKLRIFSGIPG